MRFTILSVSIILLFITGCGGSGSRNNSEIIIFHAGSLSVPFNELKNRFETKNPGLRVLLESAGSLVCARKITELKKPCDIIASADYFVIDQLLIPDYTEWSIRFATNEIVIAYTDKSAHSEDINSGNWMDILQKKNAIYGRSDPDNDPCGYRTLLTFMLAEKYYNRPGLTAVFSAKDKDYIRPKEVDLIALMESNAIDYMFQYKSVALQHGLKFIELPDEINLGEPSLADHYATVSVDVNGSKPGTKISVKGDFINYSLTILNDAPRRKEAIEFVDFLLSKEGMDIFRKNGQEPVIPFSTDNPDRIPREFMKYLSDFSKN